MKQAEREARELWPSQNFPREPLMVLLCLFDHVFVLGKVFEGVQCPTCKGYKVTQGPRPCVHCHEWEVRHVDGQCLFQPTRFKEMTQEELELRA